MRFFTNNIDKPKVVIKPFYKNDIKQDLIFKGDKGEILEIPSIDKKNPHMIYVGLGKRDNLLENDVRNISAKALISANKFSCNTILFEVFESNILSRNDIIVAIVEGMSLSNFSFKGYKSDNEEKSEINVYLKGVDSEYNKLIENTLNLTDLMNEAKELMLMPCNKLNPNTFVEYILNLSKKYSLEVEVLNDKQILNKGMNALYDVSKGSSIKARLGIIRYKPIQDEKITAIIGKGITCDTGGYCLKNSDSQPYIKGDMAGAANTIATICALAKNKCKTNVVAVIPIAENKISADSYIAGDVIKSFSGKTIEILNTDCEGRMILADALTYAIREENADRIIDMATLTGLAGTTFGSLYTPIFSNDDNFYQTFMKSAKKTGEDFWRMPLDERYKSYIKSSVADISNAAKAGTITAAMFLQEFVEDKPWIHLDIAATAAQYPSVNEYANDMPSAVAIRTIYNMLSE